MGRWVLAVLCLGLGCLGRGAAMDLEIPSSELSPEPTWQHLPRWRGFNLLNHYSREWSDRPFVEDDFRLIRDLGFDFVRLPLDYRTWTKGERWDQIDASKLKDIDRAVEWGTKYGLHVCLCFHRAPGYCINPPAERLDLWTSEEAQTVCAKHWAFFAERYRKVPNRSLSFNLFNEPTGVDNDVYARVCAVMCGAIRREDPARLILCDGTEAGTLPVRELIPLQVAQCTRGYQPFSLTHYRAPWVKGSDTWVKPQWPVTRVSSFLYGTDKNDWQKPWTLTGTFESPTAFRLRVSRVSDRADLKISADGKLLAEKNFRCGPGAGEWKKVVYVEQWKTYQNLYDYDVTGTVPGGAKKISIEVGDGDWLTWSELELTPQGGKPTTILPTTMDWGQAPAPLALNKDFSPDFSKGTGVEDADSLWAEYIAPWKALEAQGVGILVGEWGVYNKTPHDVTLRFDEAVLSNWKKAGWGWALWNLTGDFGPFDSNRADVTYESLEGHLCDREMLDLLQSY